MAIDKNNPYRKALIALLHSIDEEIPLSESNKVLILHLLNTEEAISGVQRVGQEQSQRGKTASDRGGDSKGGSASEQSKSAITSVK